MPSVLLHNVSLFKVIVSLILMALTINALHSQTLTLKPAWEGKAIRLPFKTNFNDSIPIMVDQLRFYIHYQQGHKVIHQLLDFEDADKVVIPIEFVGDSLQIFIGTEKRLDLKGVRSGPLDPSKGMYWTWLTGYIQLKVEGYCQQIKAHNHRFEYHLGYRQDQDYVLPSVTIRKMGRDQTVLIDLAHWFGGVQLLDQPKVVDPGSEASILLKRFGAAIR